MKLQEMLVLKINFWHQNESKKVYFGVDSNQITIAGQNAGAMKASVPMSTELFHGMIAISGAITWQMKFKDNQVDVAEKQAPLLNCPDDDTEKLITFSRRVHKNLVKKLFNIN
ncbi:unnamed protein product [Diamesa tonsa]